MSLNRPETNAEIIEDCQRVATDNLDRFIIVTGRERLGKSTLARWLGHKIDPGFSVDRIHFSVASLMMQAEKLPKGSVVVLDEPVDGALGAKHWGADESSFRDFMVVCGELNLVVIICSPRLDILLKYARGHRIDYWFLIQKRGSFLSHQIIRRDYPGSKNSWRKIRPHSFPDLPKDHPETQAYLEKKRRHRRDLQRRSSERYQPTTEEVEQYARPLRLIFEEAGLSIKEP